MKRLIISIIVAMVLFGITTPVISAGVRVTVEIGGREIQGTWDRLPYLRITDKNIGVLKIPIKKNIDKIVLLGLSVKEKSRSWHKEEYHYAADVILRNGDVLHGFIMDWYFEKIVSSIYGEIEIKKFPATIYIGEKPAAPGSTSTKISDWVRVWACGKAGIRVMANVPKGGYVGCSYWVADKRTDLPAQHIVGKDVIFFDVPLNAKCEVALWKEKYSLGKGPDPDNAWAKKNGYYLYGELDRKKGVNKVKD